MVLFIFGTFFWSFSSVLIYRLKTWEGWIMCGRSHCQSCNKLLQAIDLVPIFSWLAHKWKCRKCDNKISGIYPVLEIITWILFALIWYFLIDYTLIYSANLVEIIRLIFWLVIWIITVVYVFYDILFLEINESIFYFGSIFTLIILALQTLFIDFHIISNLQVEPELI